MKDLKGQNAIITGGGSGIGRGIALALARLEVNILVCGRRKGPLEQTVDLISREGMAALSVQADVSKAADVERVLHAALEAFTNVHILVNNAGIFTGAPFHELKVADWDRVMAINLRGPFLMTRAVIPHMRAQRHGHIINISSESGVEYYPDDAAYGVSKHALNALGEYVQRENQEMNIRVDTICPGMVVTEMTENDVGLNHARCLYPEDIADLAVWLLTRRQNIKIATPILIQTMLNPWEEGP